MQNPVMTAVPVLDDTAIQVHFGGTADVEAREDLEAFVKQLHVEARRLSVGAVRLDFRELSFMNSSCFKIFVARLAEVRDSEPHEQYRIQMLSNPSMLWQRRSLAALSCFASNLVTIEH
jgi:hypothetical protein